MAVVIIFIFGLKQATRTTLFICADDKHLLAGNAVKPSALCTVFFVQCLACDFSYSKFRRKCMVCLQASPHHSSQYNKVIPVMNDQI
jgi:hypothetical protein